MFLKFGEIKVDKKEFHKSKKTIDLNLIEINNVVASNKFELEEGDKYYIGYKDNEFVRSLRIISPQMSRLIKHFDGSSKKVLFLSENEKVVIKYNKIWKIITKIYGYKLDNQSVYEKKYIKIKLTTYDDKVYISFRDNNIPKE